MWTRPCAKWRAARSSTSTGCEEVTHHNLHERQKAMEAAEKILDEEMELFRARQEQLNVVPTIVSLRRAR